ncbi:hypothetical protein [Komagataeibacter xylinus]|uniref:hypothetical protein n=1 Tax=Komagataeibacter xylinus TaxID=28448 RepID=UPI00280B9CBA|nr:hypothetical protein [Komagataeibacter xylinus]
MQFILYHLGLSSQKPDPLQIPVPIDREAAGQDYLQGRRELLKTLLDEKTRRVWIRDRCREAEHRRAHVIARWHADRAPDCEQARQTVARLERLARLPRQLPESIRFAVRDLKRQGRFQMALKELDRFYDYDGAIPASLPSDHRADVDRSDCAHHVVPQGNGKSEAVSKLSCQDVPSH